MRILTMAKFDGSDCIGLCQIRPTGHLLAIFAARGYKVIPEAEYQQLLAVKRAKMNGGQSE